MRTWITPVVALSVLLSSVTYALADGFQGPMIYYAIALKFGVPLVLIGATIALVVFLTGRFTRRKDK